jgi:hypothetical protein
MKLQTQAIINGKTVFKMAWNRAKRQKALPMWSRATKNRRKILKVYIEAQLRNLNSKYKFEVDHVIPLYHPLVCGLHVYENLQVLSKEQNQDKSNLFYPFRALNGRKYYYGKPLATKKEVKIPKKYNRTKKNPLKIAKKRSKTVKNKVKSVRKKATFFRVKN